MCLFNIFYLGILKMIWGFPLHVQYVVKSYFLLHLSLEYPSPAFSSLLISSHPCHLFFQVFNFFPSFYLIFFKFLFNRLISSYANPFLHLNYTCSAFSWKIQHHSLSKLRWILEIIQYKFSFKVWKFLW